MSDLALAELTRKLDALTPENLLAVFTALLLCEERINAFEDVLLVSDGKLTDALGNSLSSGQNLVSDFGGRVPGKSADVGLRSAA